MNDEYIKYNKTVIEPLIQGSIELKQKIDNTFKEDLKEDIDSNNNPIRNIDTKIRSGLFDRLTTLRDKNNRIKTEIDKFKENYIRQKFINSKLYDIGKLKEDILNKTKLLEKFNNELLS